jgi:3'-phosphoadenosine 5'-phosphosulfate sulfotransferase (PAPS reductase)/FAD synthetase
VLSEALAEFDGWITGRKRFQAATRHTVETLRAASRRQAEDQSAGALDEAGHRRLVRARLTCLNTR